MAQEIHSTDRKNDKKVTPIVKYVSGTWVDGDFNPQQKLRLLLQKSLKHFGIDPKTESKFELRLQGATGPLSLEQTLEEAGIKDGTIVLLLPKENTDVDG